MGKATPPELPAPHRARTWRPQEQGPPSRWFPTRCSRTCLNKCVQCIQTSNFNQVKQTHLFFSWDSQLPRHRCLSQSNKDIHSYKAKWLLINPIWVQDKKQHDHDVLSKKSSEIIFLNMTETWAPATHCRSRPPRSPPGFSHLRSPFLSTWSRGTWIMEHHMDNVHHTVLLLPLTKLVEDDGYFLPMLCCQNVSQEGCFSWKKSMGDLQNDKLLFSYLSQVGQ